MFFGWEGTGTIIYILYKCEYTVISDLIIVHPVAYPRPNTSNRTAQRECVHCLSTML